MHVYGSCADLKQVIMPMAYETINAENMIISYYIKQKASYVIFN